MKSKPQTDLLRQVVLPLSQGRGDQIALTRVLEAVLAHFNCVTGTIHLLDQKSGLLQLSAQRGIPDALLEKVKVIPIGKGMAGLAAERREPVQICNLQTDTSGAAKPAARETRMEGSVAAPMMATNGELRGVLGIAKPQAYEFTKSELDLLLRIGSEVADALGLQPRQELLDQYFVETRFKLIEVAAFLDRLDRADGTADFRLDALRRAIKELEVAQADRAKRVLMSFSDPTTEPIPAAKGKSASGAYDPAS